MNEQTILTATNLREYMQSVSYYEMEKKRKKNKKRVGTWTMKSKNYFKFAYFLNLDRYRKLLCFSSIVSSFEINSVECSKIPISMEFKTIWIDGLLKDGFIQEPTVKWNINPLSRYCDEIYKKKKTSSIQALNDTVDLCIFLLDFVHLFMMNMRIWNFYTRFRLQWNAKH